MRARENGRSKTCPTLSRLTVVLGLAGGPALLLAQNPVAPDYSVPAKVWPNVLKPYQLLRVPAPILSNGAEAPLEVRDGKLRLSMAQLVAAVVENNLTVAGARYYSAAAQTDLMRARSGQSPRGVDQSAIPSGVFAGATGSSILGSAGGGGGGASNAGGITGGASAVNVGPSGVFDPSLSVNFSFDRTPSPLNTLVVAGVPQVTNYTVAASVRYVQGLSLRYEFLVQLWVSEAVLHATAPAVQSGFYARLHRQRGAAVGQRFRV